MWVLVMLVTMFLIVKSGWESCFKETNVRNSIWPFILSIIFAPLGGAITGWLTLLIFGDF